MPTVPCIVYSSPNPNPAAGIGYTKGERRRMRIGPPSPTAVVVHFFYFKVQITGARPRTSAARYVFSLGTFMQSFFVRREIRPPWRAIRPAKAANAIPPSVSAFGIGRSIWPFCTATAAGYCKKISCANMCVAVRSSDRNFHPRQLARKIRCAHKCRSEHCFF